MADGLKKTKEEEQNDSLLRSFKAKFVHAYNSEKYWREQRAEWYRFYHGDQLTEEEKTVLKQRGQPEVVINRVKPKIDSIEGMQLGLRVDTKAFPKGLMDFESAKHITACLRHIEDATDFDGQESHAFSHMIRGGRAWYKSYLKWDDLEPTTCTESLNPDFMYCDPYCTKDDLSDAKYVCESIWMDEADARELFPDFNEEFEQLLTFKDGASQGPTLLKDHASDQYKQDSDDVDATGDLDNFLDQKRRRLRVTTIWYREPFRRTFIFAPRLGTEEITGWNKKDLKFFQEGFPDAQTYTTLQYRLNCATFIWNTLLEHKTDLKSWDKDAKYPFVMMTAYQTEDERKTPYGIIKQMMDPQREINKRRSKMLHLLNTNQVFYESGAVDNESKARSEIAKADGWVKLNQGFRFEPAKNIDLAQSQFNLYMDSKSDIDNAGIRPENEGQSPASSGREFQLRQQAALQPLRRLFASLRAGRKRCAYLWLDDVQQTWTSERMVMVSDDPEAGQVVLNQQVQDPETGEIHVMNNVSIGKYDVLIEEAPDTVNLQGEQFEGLVQMASNGIPIPPDMIIEASSLPNKQKILERMQQQQQMQQQMMAQQQGQAPAQA